MIGVHLVGGMLGSLLVGVFADVAVNPAGRNGLFFGGGRGLLGEQAFAVGATIVYSGVVTSALCLVLRAVMPHGIRVSDEDEQTGLDLTQHSEVGYALERV